MKQLLLLSLLIIVATTTSTYAQIVNIPDIQFKNALLNHNPPVDTNNDDEIQVTEAEAVDSLYLKSKGISDLTGINSFVNLEYLNCENNSNLSSLDVSNLTDLKSLNCGGCHYLTSLNVTNLINLQNLNCWNDGGALTSLDVTNLVNLQTLNCSGNKISSLDILNLANLQTLNCSFNNLTSLDLTNVTDLQILYCADNNLTSLDFSDVPNLKKLIYSYNNIVDIDFSDVPNLIYLDCGNNNLTSFDLADVPNLKYLSCYRNSISYLNLADAPNLDSLYCFENDLTSLDLTYVPNLKYLSCGTNNLTSLDLTYVPNLKYLSCGTNNLTSLDFSDVIDLRNLTCSNNNLTILDLTNMSNLKFLNCSFNSLTSLLVKNGSNETSLNFSDNPDINYICCDENQIEEVINKAVGYGLGDFLLNTYCTFEPGSNSNKISGTVRLDMGNNDCSENAVSVGTQLLQVSDGSEMGYIIADTLGKYNFYCNEGTFSLQPLWEHPYFSTPSPAFASFDTTNNLISLQNFCITPNGTHHDLEITLLPVNNARPGFDAKYQITYQNQGTETESGSVSLQFDDSVLDFVSASPNVVAQSDSLLTWNFVDLQPFESRSIAVILNVNSPQEIPAVNGDDILSFLAYLNYAYTDETPEDNSSALRQTVVNSYDPNDKTCLQGTAVEVKNVGDYLDYVIRFQNTGSAEAINVIVTDELAANLDVSTFQMISASHDYRFRLEGRTVEFYFENINLPDSTSNEPESHGFVAFKIKPKAVALGDKIENTAQIYFDYNFPIITNTTETEVIEDISEPVGLAALQSKSFFTITPNPASEYISLGSKYDNIAQVEIYDSAGRLHIVQTSPDARINIQNLPSGVYTLKVQIGEQWYAEKFVVGR